MDDELKELAALVLRNAFWEDFSALVNRYLEAAEGLDVEDQEMLMGEMTSVYGRDELAQSRVPLSIQSAGPGYTNFTHKTIAGALRQTRANQVFLQGQKVFERKDGEWFFVGDPA